MIAERIPDNLIDQAKRVDLLALAQAYGPMRRNAHHDWQGTCPKCGQDYWHVYQTPDQEWRWRCYECHEQPADGIDLLRWLQPGLGFREAVLQLTGGTMPASAPATPRPERPQPKTQTDEWRQQATELVEESHYRLWMPSGDPGRRYLLERGLEPHTWQQFDIGYHPSVAVPGTEGKERSPAIVMPWYAGGRLVGVRFRFLRPPAGGPKLASRMGSVFAGKLFGGQAIERGCEHLKTLVLCEGEINAMSIWQLAHDTRLDVLSLGSESAKLTPAMIEAARRYQTVIVWADRDEIARQLQTAIPFAGRLTSPDGRDANDLLQAGLLGAVLGLARLRACRTDHQREGLLWNLWDAANSWQGVDTGTARAIQRIAGELGKPVQLREPEPGRWIATPTGGAL